KHSLKGVVNGVLRQFIRQQTQLMQQAVPEAIQHCHPDWLVQQLKHAYPDQWPAILTANNQKAPIWLRVNRLHHTTEAYQALLTQQGIHAEQHKHCSQALRLANFVAVDQLPGFTQGWVTIQDLSAQQAVQWLEPQNNEQILDLCAAPGGKTTHILELAPQAKVWAVDIDAQRLQRVQANLQRLQQTAHIVQGDACQPQQWAAGQQFDRILVDAPCSATGVIRRHPDIKWLRRASDIPVLVNLQQQILTAIWPYLKANGILVYTT